MINMTDTYICIQEPRFNGKLDEKGDRDVDWICINEGLFEDFWIPNYTLGIFNRNSWKPIDFNSDEYKDYPSEFKDYLDFDLCSSGIISSGNLRISFCVTY